MHHLERLKKMLEGTLVEARFTKWMNALVQAYFDERGYGMENENTESEIWLKRRLVDYACYRADVVFSMPCREEARAQVKDWIKSNSSKSPINPYLRRTFYKVVLIEAGLEENSEIVDFFLAKYEEAKTKRFLRHEHFQRLKEAYDFYTLVASNSTTEAGSINGEETSIQGLEAEDLCSTIIDDEFSSELPEIGRKVLRKCWHNIKESEKAVKKVRELVGMVVSRNEIESVERWAREENVREDVRQAVEELTDKATARLKCTDMVAKTLGKLLPE